MAACSQRSSFLEHFGYPASGVLDLLAVLGVCREGAAKEDLTRRTAQDLIVGRDDRGPAQRVYAALHRRGAYFRALHEALDDAAHLAEFMPVVLPGFAGRLEADPARQLLLDPEREIPLLRSPVVTERRVALAREALVQLDHRAPQPGIAAFELGDGLRDVL